VVIVVLHVGGAARIMPNGISANMLISTAQAHHAA
jgi:hypothetical protein